MTQISSTAPSNQPNKNSAKQVSTDMGRR